MARWTVISTCTLALPRQCCLSLCYLTEHNWLSGWSRMDLSIKLMALPLIFLWCCGCCTVVTKPQHSSAVYFPVRTEPLQNHNNNGIRGIHEQFNANFLPITYHYPFCPCIFKATLQIQILLFGWTIIYKYTNIVLHYYKGKHTLCGVSGMLYIHLLLCKIWNFSRIKQPVLW